MHWFFGLYKWLRMKKLFVVVFSLVSIVINSQDIGPHTIPLIPEGITTINLIYTRIETNLTPSKDVILVNGIIDVDAILIPVVHSFSIGGLLSKVYITPGVGSVNGAIDIETHEHDIVNIKGLLDANVMMQVGILNTPVLDVENFKKRKLNFQLSGLLGITVPIGQYYQTRRINLGGNRWAFKVGLPMVIPLNNNKEKIFQWEIIPSVTFYTNNNKPRVGNVKTQNPLFWLEQHFSKNFTNHFWASLNIDYQYGGRTYIDGVSGSNNLINQLAVGVTAGYTPFKNIPLSFHGTYSRTWFNGTSGYLFLFGATTAIPSKSDRLYMKTLHEQ